MTPNTLVSLIISSLNEDQVKQLIDFDLELSPLGFCMVNYEIQVKIKGYAIMTNGHKICAMFVPHDNCNVIVTYYDTPYIHTRGWENEYPKDEGLIKYCGEIKSVTVLPLLGGVGRHTILGMDGTIVSHTEVFVGESDKFIIDGKYMHYFDGLVEVEGTIRQGQNDGIWYRFYPGTNIVFHSYEFKSGYLDGPTYIYKPDGTLDRKYVLKQDDNSFKISKSVEHPDYDTIEKHLFINNEPIFKLYKDGSLVDITGDNQQHLGLEFDFPQICAYDQTINIPSFW